MNFCAWIPSASKTCTVTLLWILLAGCSPILPSILEDENGKGPSLAKLSVLHPVGSKSQDLVAELERQGFEVSVAPGVDPKSLKSEGRLYDARKRLWGSIIPCTVLVKWRPNAEDDIMEYVRQPLMGCASP